MIYCVLRVAIYRSCTVRSILLVSSYCFTYSWYMKTEYVVQIKTYHKCLHSASLAKTFGITKGSTSNYMIVIKYYENGDLYQMNILIVQMEFFPGGLERTRAKGRVHKNLCRGNLLIEDEKISTDARIGDVGLYGPCDYHEDNNNSGQIYGLAIDLGMRAHDHYSAKSICVEITEDTPKFYAELMQQC
ncbi:hypothetical protein RhiirC2_790520 [Rhizophagus irregularis]|uniref:Protein kinase domain-containing protein n=1 Tax=Rhizophagus irregularis TaxID=588596 RepID=A0A2N1ML36_9GLOM|nr:hypothetical protein RhiirC2_790520 [Rhizophagus irregularis]